jgi:hypothetical protein
VRVVNCRRCGEGGVERPPVAGAMTRGVVAPAPVMHPQIRKASFQ